MKTTCLTIIMFLIVSNAHAQLSGGIKLNLGAGGIHSENLQNNLTYQDEASAKITSWTVDESWNFGFGIGGFLSYRFSDQLSLAIEPTLNFLKCEMDISRTEDNIGANGDGDVKIETTESDIDLTYLYMPILLKYELPSKFYLTAGLGIHFTGSPTITSTAISQKDDYKNGALDKSTIDPKAILETELDEFDSPRFDFVIGVGKAFDMNGKDLMIDIRYNLPLTQSEMYTTDPNYNDGLFKHNDMLSLKGKTDAENNAPILLNDFQMSMISLNVALTLFKN